jgi:hypothetical protein
LDYFSVSAAGAFVPADFGLKLNADGYHHHTDAYRLTIPVCKPPFFITFFSVRLGAFEWDKMMKAKAGRISIGSAGLFHALGHHLS